MSREGSPAEKTSRPAASTTATWPRWRLSTSPCRLISTRGAGVVSRVAESNPARRGAAACRSVRATAPSCLTVDLGLLKLARIVDVNRLPFRERVDHGRAAFAVAVPGFLHAAEGELHFGADGRAVHVGNAGLDVPDGAHRLVHVARV